jgi:hypothetical protein
LIDTRRVFAALALPGLALLGFVSLLPIGEATAQDTTAALVAKQVSLSDMAMGSIKAPVIITEYASMSCPHCAAFGENVFPMLKSNISTPVRCVSCFGNSRSTSRPRDLDAGPLHRQRGCREVFWCCRSHVQTAGAADGSDHRYPESDRQAERDERAGRSRLA